MIKKLYIVAAAALVLGLTGCSKSATDYLEEVEKLFNQYKEYVDEGDTEEAAKVKEKAEVLIEEINNKAKEDPEFKTVIDKKAPEIVNFLLGIPE